MALASTPNKQYGLYTILWHYSTISDKILQSISIVAAIGAGTTRPLMTIVFGNLVNEFNNSAALSASRLKVSVNRNVLYFVYLFIAQLLLTYTFSSIFSIVATRLTRNLRLAYLQAIVRHDQSYRDTSARRSAANDISNEVTQVKHALSETLGIAIQACSTVATAFIIAFTQSWRLTLVMSTAIITLFSGLYITTKFETRAETQISGIYSEAAALLEEVFSSIHTVIALGADSKILTKYGGYMNTTRKLNLKKSPLAGVKFVLSYFVLLSSYALAFWYGVKLVVENKVASSGNVVM